MYSRPVLSRSTAPRPSTNTSGSCSKAHHSGMSVKGCQTNRLSASISSSVFHSVMIDTRFWVLILYEIWAAAGSSIQHQESRISFPFVIHRRAAPELPSRSKQRLRLKHAAADIFEKGFLSKLADPPAMGDHSRSSQDRRQFLPGTATRRRTSLRELRVFCRLDFCPSICVDSASQCKSYISELERRS